MSRRRSVVLLAPGSDTTWRDGSRLITEPTAVAVDGAGTVRAFGSNALLHAARRGSGLSLVRPYTSTRILHPQLARSFLSWIMDGHRHGRQPVLAVIDPADPPGLAEDWQELGRSLGVPTVSVSRPLAAGEGLGLDVDSKVAHMIVDLKSDAAEVSVVAEGGVLACHQFDDPTPRHVASVTRSLLIQIDPDLECDIADRGIHLLGAAGSEWPREYARLVRIPVNLPVDSEQKIFDGAGTVVDTLQPYLVTMASGVGGRLRAVLAGFGH